MTQEPAHHLFFRRVRLASRGPYFSLELRPALHAVIVESASDCQAFVACAAGIREPDRGRVTFGRTRPSHAPELRARLGTVLKDEPPLLGAKVRGHVQHILDLRRRLGVPGVETAHDVPLIRSLLDTDCDSLAPEERRRVALGLALSLGRPAALVLHDPLFGLGDDEISLVSEALAERAQSVVVACTVPSEISARRLSEHSHHLTAREPLSAEAAVFLLRVERPREVASLLCQSPLVLGAHLHPRHAGELIVATTAEVPGAEAIQDAICRSGVDVFEMRRTSRTLGDAR